MGQIPYTLKFKLGKPNKQKECLVYLRYYSSENDILIPSNVRVPAGDFNPDKPASPIRKQNPLSAQFNAELTNLKINVQQRIHSSKGQISLDYLTGYVASSDSLYDYIQALEKQLKGKLSVSTLKQYGVIRRKVDAYDPNATFKSVSVPWLNNLEQSIRDTGIANNTINTNFKKLKSIFSRAVTEGLMDKSQFESYKVTPYVQNIPVYLTETEIESFEKIVVNCAEGPIKRAGYYFLLGCYTGLRISDLSAFIYKERVKDGALILRAKKNGSIISLPLYPKLKLILEYCRKHTLSMFEQDMRDHVKVIAKLAGIKQDIKVHSARHSFAMLMIKRGLKIDEIAELLGDSKDVAKVYARITNPHLHRRVMDVMK